MAMLSLSCGTYVTPDVEARDAERVPELLPRQRSLVLELEAVAEQNVASPEPVVVHAPLLLARQRSLGLQADAPLNAALGPEADAAVACAQSSKKRKRSCRTGTGTETETDDADEEQQEEGLIKAPPRLQPCQYAYEDTDEEEEVVVPFRRDPLYSFPLQDEEDDEEELAMVTRTIVLPKPFKICTDRIPSNVVDLTGDSDGDGDSDSDNDNALTVDLTGIADSDSDKDEDDDEVSARTKKTRKHLSAVTKTENTVHEHDEDENESRRKAELERQETLAYMLRARNPLHSIGGRDVS